MTYRPPLHQLEGKATEWVPWFAWYPVRLHKPYEFFPGLYMPGTKRAWLRWIERRYFYAAPWFVIHRWTEYRE